MTRKRGKKLNLPSNNVEVENNRLRNDRQRDKAMPILNRTFLEENFNRGELENLTELCLGWRDLKSIDPSTIASLKNVTTINLCKNRLNSPLDENIFEKNSDLERINLSFNELGRIHPKTFRGLKRLKSLELGSVKLSNIDSQTFQDLESLVVLTLTNNSITSIDSKLFERLTNLTQLNLNGNKLTSISSGLFSSLKNLIRLDLDSNLIHTLQAHSFDGLENLEELELSMNQLKSIDNKVFHGLRNLTKLRFEFLGYI